MSELIGKEAFRVGMEEILRNLEDGIEAYKDFLMIYEILPNMEVIEELKKVIDKVDTATGEFKK